MASSSHRLFTVYVVIAVAGAPHLALSQQLESSDQLEEVVVTATKRASNLQDTPISITAITGKDLEDRGITNISAIAQAVPGVSMRSSGPGQTELEMRGMTSAGGNSPTVGFYLDDTPLTAPAAAMNGKVVIDPDLYDLNRVEVLRGPQGTLYGSGSMGGTIKLVPNAPNAQYFDASGELILGGTDGGGFNHGENAMLNLPLVTDEVALRLAGSDEHLSGWINRVVIAPGDFPAPINSNTRGNVASAPVAADYKGVNDEDLQSFRVALLLKPTDRLSIAPAFLYQRITQDGLSLIDNPPGANSQYQPYDEPEPFADRIDIGSLNVRYGFDAFEISSTTSYWTREEKLHQDGTEEIADAIGVPIYPPGGFGPTTPATFEDDKSSQTTEELRLTSVGDTRFTWLFGYFYQDFESSWDLFAITPEAVPLTGTANGFSQYQPTKIIQDSFFGEISFKLLPELTGTAGLRRYSYTGTVDTAVSGWLSSSGNDTWDYFHTEERDQGVTPKFNLSYQPNKDLLVYSTAAKGFRPGGGNQPIPTTGPLGAECLQNLQQIAGLSAAPLGFAPDSVWSYELGEKFRSSDSRVTLNSAAYFENWEHIQQSIPLACGFPYNGNAGEAHIYGGELELDALLIPQLVLTLNTGYSHARYTANAVPGTTLDDRVQSVPDWTSAASLSYRRPVSDQLTLVARIDNTYVGSRIDTTAQANYLPSYDLTNVRVGLQGSRWSAALFVNNVANKVAELSDATAINVNVSTFNRVAVSQPLTFGVDLSYRFGP